MNCSEQLNQAVAKGGILNSAAQNLQITYNTTPNNWVKETIEELLQKQQYTEINDRFFKRLAFGTGGIRGRTIGKYVTAAERGTPNAFGCPEHACVGSNAMNDDNVERAMRGLCRYLKAKFSNLQPTVVISHDTRHFSRHFVELCAHIALNEGVHACLFEAERSTPQLSYTVRYLNAQGGVMITASHNPPHDNGFKAYFDDGGQLVEPHATGVITEVNTIVPSEDHTPTNNATLRILGNELDEAYLTALETLVLDPHMLRKQAPHLKVVYTPLHGTGSRAVLPILQRFDVNALPVASQSIPDGRFPTVKSPNPENGEALSLGIEEAKKYQALAVIATDPDCDRMGVALRNHEGEYELITGNQIGSIMAYYRISTLFKQGILHADNTSHACLIKTFVTSDLQAAIAQKYGLKVINTLTGFKYIGEKMLQYEHLIADTATYRKMSLKEQRSAQLAKGCYFVFGGEESYGYSGGDYVRDKDGNAAVLMFVEALAAVQSQSITLLEYLDQIYAEFGFYQESLGQIVLEGAEGAAKIAKMLNSYENVLPTQFLDQPVVHIENFSKQDFTDADGKPIPKELMLIFHLKNGSRIAVRGSGTEPKVKFYLFTNQTPPANSSFSREELQHAKVLAKKFLTDLWQAVQEDALKRTD